MSYEPVTSGPERTRGVAAVPDPASPPPARVASSRRTAIVLTAFAVVLALVVGGAAVVDAATDVKRGTSVLGVDIGGRSRTEAAAALVSGLGARLAAPVTVGLAGTTVELNPVEVGLALDVEATVDAAARGGVNPFRPLFGGDREVEPVVSVDADRLATALAEPAKKAGRPMTQPKITFSGVTPVPTYPVAGQGVDPAVAAAALRGGWLRADVVAVPLSDIDPKTSRADLDRLLADLARPAVAAPVTVRTSRGDLVVPPAAIAASLILTADATGTITPRIDERKLRAALAKQLAAIEVQPRDATVRAGDGSVRILASSGGALVDTAKLSRDLVGVLGRPAPRTVAGALKTVAPKTTTSDLTKLGIKQQISTFTTYFPAGQDRTKNIVLIAKEVDGAVVEPGETFSLNGHTGIRGYAEGYVDAPVISDGRLVNAVGGGNSQFTTTLFNAAYYAGLEDVYHQPHSFYISRYPSVIEATIIYPTVDLKFRNDTPYGVLIDTSWTSGSITVTMWSTKRYDVSTVWGPRRDIVEPVTRHLPDDDECIPTSGTRGFAQDAWRVFKQNGVEVKREKFSWRYDAQARFVCG